MPVSYGAGAVIDAFGGIDQIDAKKVSIAAMFQITAEQHLGFR
mgnify:FL=1